MSKFKLVLILLLSFIDVKGQSETEFSQKDTNLLIRQVLIDYHKIYPCCEDSVFFFVKKFSCPNDLDSLKVICFNETDKKFKKKMLRKHEQIPFILIKEITFKDDSAYVVFGDGAFFNFHKQPFPKSIVTEYVFSYKVDKINKKFIYLGFSGGVGN